MKNFLKRIRADYLFSSILSILFGLAFVIWPSKVNETVGLVIGIALIAIGAIYLAGFLFGLVTNGVSAAMGVMVLIVGVIVLVNPRIIGMILPCLIGVILLVHGVRGIRESVVSKKYGYGNWSAGVVLAAVCIVLGTISIVGAIFGKFGVVEWPYILIGIALIYNGLSNLWISVHSSRYERKYNKQQDELTAQFVEDQQSEEGQGDQNASDGV